MITFYMHIVIKEGYWHVLIAVIKSGIFISYWCAMIMVIVTEHLLWQQAAKRRKTSGWKILQLPSRLPERGEITSFSTSVWSHAVSTVKPGFYIFEGTIWNDCKVKEMKIYGVIEIKYMKVILYSIKNAI